MPIDSTKLANLLALAKPAVAEVFQVSWADDDIRYYAISKFDSIPPFTDVKQYLDDGNGGTAQIEARIINSGFHSFELSADLRTEEISITFSDSDDSIKTAFQTYGDGARIELFYYYPQVDLWTSVWFGSLLQPEIWGRGTMQCKASNGFKSRELSIGHRSKPTLCPFVFGGKMTVNDYRGSGCIYDRQLGGSNGNLNGGVPYTSCDKSESACVARLGAHANGKAKYWGGVEPDASPIVSDANGYLARTKGNASSLKIPYRIIAGSKYVSGNENLYFRKELNSSNPDNGFVSGLWFVGEGQCEQVDEIFVNEKRIELQHLNIRNGALGQSPTAYAPDVSGFSGTAHFFARYGWVNAATTELSSLSTRARVQGYNQLRIYSDATTYSPGWTSNRVWWILELYTNLRFGLGYLHSRFDIDAFIAAATWVSDYVRFTDNFSNTYDHVRARFDAIIEPRTASEVIIDICRTGRISVPFQYDGKYTIATLKPLTSGELAAVKIFSDFGLSRNIVWEENAQSISLSKMSDKQLVNILHYTYEDASRNDKERPLTVQDEDQQLLAGKAYGMGDSSPQDVPKNYTAFGCREKNQVIKLAFATLNLGEFDSGGIQNNLRVRFYVPFEQALGMKKFEVFKVESDLLNSESFSYFRVQTLKATNITIDKNLARVVEIVGQAYNHTYSTNLEVLTSSLPSPPTEPPQTPSPPTPNPLPCDPGFGSITYDDTTGTLSIPVPPC